jgi:hypothetical protein
VSFVLNALAFFIRWPLAALIPAALFFFIFHWRKTSFALIAAILWALYAVYESLMAARVLCSGECNIRIDLIALYPLLAVVSLIALVELAIRALRRKPRPHGPA